MSAYSVTRKRGGGPQYVSHIPGRDGVDWGFTSSWERALDLNTYWSKRFESYAQQLGWYFNKLPAPVSYDELKHAITEKQRKILECVALGASSRFIYSAPERLMIKTLIARGLLAESALGISLTPDGRQAKNGP